MRLAVLLLLAAPLSAHAASQDFLLANHTGYRIDRVYLSPSGQNDWGDNTLGIDFVGNGERAAVSFDHDQPGCVWDLRVQYHDDTSVTWTGLDICDIRRIGLYYDKARRLTLARVQ